MPNYKSIIYVSTAATGLTRETAKHIGEQAKLTNADVGLTGILAYNGFNFMQLLEGHSNDVLDCLGRIVKDPRHTGLVLISQRTVNAREFDDWSMELFNYDPNSPTPEERLKDSLGRAEVSNETRTMFNSFECFAQKSA